MDMQLKRGFLDACVLKVLTKGESYGYLIIREMESIVPISESTLYPILRRLEGGGYLTVRKTEHNGRLRKYYSITELGNKKLDATLEDLTELEKIKAFLTE